MKKLKVALIQYNAVTPDIEQNTIAAIKLIREAAQNGADLVLFPECFLTGYAAPDICKKLLPVQEIENHPDFIKWRENALTEDEEHFIQIVNLAVELNIGVVITGFSKGKKYPQNTAWIINREGKVILKYSKVHTCDFDWERYLESGDSFPVCWFDEITMGCMICYDREYPESARELMLNGAELIMHPNCCGAMPPRLKELSVRAMENMVGIAMANPPARGMGNSCAFNPMVWTKEGAPLDNTVFVGDELEETIYYVEFDMDEIRAYKERGDLGRYRKTKAYKNWHGMTEMRNQMYDSQGKEVTVNLKDGTAIHGICDFYTQPLDNEPEVASICIRRPGCSSLTEIMEPEIKSIEYAE